MLKVSESTSGGRHQAVISSGSHDDSRETLRFPSLCQSGSNFSCRNSISSRTKNVLLCGYAFFISTSFISHIFKISPQLLSRCHVCILVQVSGKSLGFLEFQQLFGNRKVSIVPPVVARCGFIQFPCQFPSFQQRRAVADLDRAPPKSLFPPTVPNIQQVTTSNESS